MGRALNEVSLHLLAKPSPTQMILNSPLDLSRHKGHSQTTQSYLNLGNLRAQIIIILENTGVLFILLTAAFKSARCPAPL
jgi:hypothetical protein